MVYPSRYGVATVHLTLISNASSTGTNSILLIIEASVRVKASRSSDWCLPSRGMPLRRTGLRLWDHWLPLISFIACWFRCFFATQKQPDD